MKTSLACFFALTIAFKTSGQSFALTGRVIDKNGDAIPSAKVYIFQNRSQVTMTDQNGGFKIEKVPAHGTVIASINGVCSAQKNLTDKENITIQLMCFPEIIVDPVILPLEKVYPIKSIEELDSLTTRKYGNVTFKRNFLAQIQGKYLIQFFSSTKNTIKSIKVNIHKNQKDKIIFLRHVQKGRFLVQITNLTNHFISANFFEVY